MGFLAHSTATAQRNLKKTSGTGLRSTSSGSSPKAKVPRTLVTAPNNVEFGEPDPIDYIKNVSIILIF